LPKPVTHRAAELLEEYEKEDAIFNREQNDNSGLSEVERKLAEIDSDNLSPVEALMKIYELKNILEKNKNFVCFTARMTYY
jgi:DNA mismatch repair ATPase MutS